MTGLTGRCCLVLNLAVNGTFVYLMFRALGCNDRCDREVLSCSHSSSERHSSSRDEVKTKRSIRFQDKDR